VTPSKSPTADRQAAPCPVNTFNEWDPLEEIIVGVVEDALIPPWETITPAVVHDRSVRARHSRSAADVRQSSLPHAPRLGRCRLGLAVTRRAPRRTVDAQAAR
jgi:hypothetical protein